MRVCSKCGVVLGDDITSCKECNTYNPLPKTRKKSSINGCKVIGYLILVLGIVSAIFIAFKQGVTITSTVDLFDEVEFVTERDWVKTIIIFVSLTFLSIAGCVLFTTLANIKEKLDVA